MHYFAGTVWAYSFWGLPFIAVILWLAILLFLAMYKGKNKLLKTITKEYFYLMDHHKVLYWLYLLVLPMTVAIGIEYAKYNMCTANGYKIVDARSSYGRSVGFKCIDKTK